MDYFFNLASRTWHSFWVLLMNVVAGWQESTTEASSEMSQQVSQGERKKRVWDGGADRSNQRESRYFTLQTFHTL